MIAAPRTVFAATVVGLVLASCAALPQSPPDVPEFVPEVEPSIQPADIYVSDDGFSRVQRISLRVRTESCTGYSNGSAWMLDATTAVSNRHVVEDATHVEVTTYDGRNFVVTDMVVTDTADLALLTIDGEFTEFAVIADQEPDPGQTLHVVGYPEGTRLTVESGRYLTEVEDTLDENVDMVYAVSALSKPGNSGSPVADDDDQVVGVLFASNGFRTSYVVPLPTLKDFLEDTSTHKDVNNSCPWD